MSDDKLVAKLKKEGKAKHQPDWKYDIHELALGIKVEMEHTTSKAVAKEIAKDHLEEDDEYYSHLVIMEKKNIKKSHTEGKIMNGSRVALVVVLGNDLEKAAKLSKVGSKHPAGLSGVNGEGVSGKNPSPSHTERMKLAKMSAQRMLAPKPENAKAHTPVKNVGQGARDKGQKPPYANFGMGASGMSSQAHNMFGVETFVVSPSELASSAPEKTSKYASVKNIAKPRG